MIKTNISIVLLVFCAILKAIAQNTPAFPKAEGYGKYVTGGRGGKVVYVTHIKDNTDKFGAGYPGSLRAALETSGNDPITIVFKCGGVIQPMGTLTCSRSNVTIAGQTALGDGICVMGYGIKFSGSNIMVRHMRFRVGDRINQNDPALTFSNAKKAIFDHCSFSWSVEENVNITDVDSVTLQWCINSESLYNSIHIKGERAYAAQWGGEHSSFHHNLLAHHNSRMPRQNGNTSNDHHLTWDYRNNVHYNWGNDGAFYGGGIEESGGWSHSNLINNYYKPGPATTKTLNNQYFCAPSGGRPAVVGTGNEFLYGYGLWYLNGNIMYNNPDKTNNNWAGLNGSSNFYATDAFDAALVTTTSADIAYEQVLAEAGATKPKRDSIDRRIVNEVKNGSAIYGGDRGSACGIIDSHTTYMADPSTVGSVIQAWEKTLYTEVKSTSTLVPADSDADGIPDWWETAHGLSPTDTSDGKAKASNGSGYTNLELYLNSDEVGKTSGTSVMNTNVKHALTIYPMPVSDNFYIESEETIVNVKLYDITGKLMLTRAYTPNTSVLIYSLLPGLYYIKATYRNGQTQMEKIVKK